MITRLGSMGVDWAATGNWMQAWAGFAQAAAIVFVAYKGADAFKMWRRQKIEERRMEAAERILTLTYRVRRALSSIRHPMMWGGALAEAKQSMLDRGFDFEGLSKREQDNKVYAQAVFERVKQFSWEWDELAAVAPVAAALFGRELEKSLENLWRQRNAVVSAAESYSEDDGSDKEYTRALQADMWENLGTRNKEADKVSGEVRKSVDEIEAALLPVLRSELVPPGRQAR